MQYYSGAMKENHLIFQSTWNSNSKITPKKFVCSLLNKSKLQSVLQLTTQDFSTVSKCMEDLLNKPLFIITLTCPNPTRFMTIINSWYNSHSQPYNSVLILPPCPSHSYHFIPLIILFGFFGMARLMAISNHSNHHL